MPVEALISPPADSISSAMCLGGAPLGALEGHVFEEMGDAVFFRLFVPGSGLHPNAERHGFEMGHGVGQHVQAVGQAGNLNTHDCNPITGLFDRTGRNPSPLWRCSAVLVKRSFGHQEVG